MNPIFLNGHISYWKSLNKILDVMVSRVIKYAQNGTGCVYFIMRVGYARNRCHKENPSDQGVDH